MTGDHKGGNVMHNNKCDICLQVIPQNGTKYTNHYKQGNNALTISCCRKCDKKISSFELKQTRDKAEFIEALKAEGKVNI